MRVQPGLVSYTNTQYGRIQFTKTTNTGNQLDGWVFQVKDSNYDVVGEYTTDENGYAITEKLPPGRYLVQELSNGDDYWNIDVMLHDVGSCRMTGQLSRMSMSTS